jgi:hypothetical protein
MRYNKGFFEGFTPFFQRLALFGDIRLGSAQKHDRVLHYL